MDLSKFGVEISKKEEEKENNFTLDFSAKDDKKLNIDFSKIKEDYIQEEQERFLPWFLKYRLEKAQDLFETIEIKKIKKFFEAWKKKGSDKDTKEAQKIRDKGLLLVGMPGSGKTTTLTLFGEEYDYEIYEMNASDARNKKSIQEHIGDVIKQKSLFQKEKLILIDEADGVSGTNDRGGLAEIVKLTNNSPFPIVFTANDKDSDKIKAIKKITTVIDFENHSFELLYNIALKIFKEENILFEKKDLEKFIEERNNPDIRGFINDLQLVSVGGRLEIGEDGDLELRDYKRKIETVLEKIFYSYPEDSLKSTFNSDVNLDDLMLYLEENIPQKYQKNALNLAFNELSKADVFKGRIIKWQYWRYLVYINFYLTFGISQAKGNTNLIGSQKENWNRNDRILKKWIYSNKIGVLQPRTKIQKNNLESEKFVEKVAKIYGCSVKKFRKENFQFFLKSFQNNPYFRESMIEKLEIDSSTINLLENWR